MVRGLLVRGSTTKTAWYQVCTPTFRSSYCGSRMVGGLLFRGLGEEGAVPLVAPSGAIHVTTGVGARTAILGSSRMVGGLFGGGLRAVGAGGATRLPALAAAWSRAGSEEVWGRRGQGAVDKCCACSRYKATCTRSRVVGGLFGGELGEEGAGGAVEKFGQPSFQVPVLEFRVQC